MPGTKIYVEGKQFVAMHSPDNDCKGCVFSRFTHGAEMMDCWEAEAVHDCYEHSVIFVRYLPEDEQCGVGNG